MRLTSVAFVLALARVASAQGTGMLEGVVTDSVHARPLANVAVRATRIGGGRDTTYEVASDALGRFRFDRISAGRYAIGFASDLLDSLEFGGPVPQVTVTAGETAHIALAVPSGATLRGIACPGVEFARRTGALVGFVTDADTERALAGAEVLVAWSALTVDSSTHKIVPDQRLTRVTIDANGQYRACGVPTGEWLVVQVQHAGRAGATVRLSIVDAIGVHVRHLSFSAEGARVRADVTRAEDDTTALPALAGTSTLLGTVRSENGVAVSGAQVGVGNAGAVVRTDALGQYMLARLPAGTQELEVKHLGFRIERRTVELRTGRTTTADVALGRAIMLDSIAIVATRLRYADFESHRKLAIRGTFVDPAEVDRRRQYASYVSDMVRESPGYIVAGQGSTAVVTHGDCELLVVIDYDMRNRTVNDVAPSDVGAIELYPNKASAPSRMRLEMDRLPRVCGALQIWTKR